MVGRKSEVKADKVRFEIMRLRRRFTQPRRKIENIDLTEIIIDGQSAHNYWI